MCGPFSVKMLREKTSNSIPVHFELECYPSNTVSNFDFLKQQLRLKELPAKHWRSQSSRRLRRCSDILPPSLSFCCWSLFLLVLRYMSLDMYLEVWLCLGLLLDTFPTVLQVFSFEKNDKGKNPPGPLSYLTLDSKTEEELPSRFASFLIIREQMLFKVCPVLVSFPRKLGQCWTVSHLWSQGRPLVHRQVVFIMY